MILVHDDDIIAYLRENNLGSSNDIESDCVDGDEVGAAIPVFWQERSTPFSRLIEIEQLHDVMRFEDDSQMHGTLASDTPSRFSHFFEQSVFSNLDPHYNMPMASASQEMFDDDSQVLYTSVADTPSYALFDSFEESSSTSVMDQNAFNSDSESKLAHHSRDGYSQKKDHRREIEYKSRKRIRLAAQRLRNVIAPGMRPGQSLRGAADVMEEAADQLR